MRNIFDNIWRYIIDIFVDDIRDDPYLQTIEARDFTEHYRVDFPNIALDRVLVAVEYTNIEDILESYKYHSERSYVHVFVNMLS